MGIGYFLIYLLHRRGRDKLLYILIADNKQEFIMRLREVVDRRCFKSPILRGTPPQNDEEYYSFFHHLFLPFSVLIHERSTRSNSRIIKVTLILSGVTTILLVFVAAFIIAKVGLEGMSLILIILGIAACFISLILLLYLLARFGAEDISLYREIDKRFSQFYGGQAPQQYRIPLSSVMEAFDRKMAKLHPFGLGYQQPIDNRPAPKSWSQFYNDMFPGDRK